MTTKLNEIQKTLIDQLRVLNPFFLLEYNIRTVVIMNETTLRLHSKASKTINIDIRYNRGSDLYDITAYKLENFGLDVSTIFNEKGIFCDQLDETLRSILKKG